MAINKLCTKNSSTFKIRSSRRNVWRNCVFNPKIKAWIEILGTILNKPTLPRQRSAPNGAKALTRGALRTKAPEIGQMVLKRELKQTYNRERCKRGGETNLFQCMVDPGLTYSSFCGQERGKIFYFQVCLIPFSPTIRSVDEREGGYYSIPKYAWSRLATLRNQSSQTKQLIY